MFAGYISDGTFTLKIIFVKNNICYKKIGDVYSTPDSSVENRVNYIQIKSKFSDLNGADGVKLNEMQFSFNQDDKITLDFSTKFPPDTYPKVYIYYLINDFTTVPPLTGLNNYQAINNKNGTYTTSIPNVQTRKPCPELLFIVTNYPIEDDKNIAQHRRRRRRLRLGQRRMQTGTLPGTYCATTCESGQSDAILRCIKANNFRDIYNSYSTYYQRAVDGWAQYVLNNEMTLQNYGLDFAEAIAGMGNCVYGCYIGMILKDIAMTKRIFDARSQCAMVDSSSSAEEEDIIQDFENVLTGD
ncbi:hypothetical protein RFI_36319 [Reticulomyxa filosa]|uniref:Uncharacterized protein n=1 Tax=Reticulomyxa filosa TaxID=46433 RepID=X6LIB8_RETFI|nr:hypothetical protein RFI_36319 [Reticulomyxa filosa]|eukprot:ETO01121.1 hypothetical protein RFI_36319 [Reticulomyxa filosa]